MRTLVIAIAIASLVSPAASASVPHPQALVIDHVGRDVTLLVWTPLVGASSYTVYKQSSGGAFLEVERTSATYFIDMAGSAGDVYQVIGSSIFGEQSIDGPSAGDCLSTSSDLRVSVSAENCLKGI